MGSFITDHSEYTQTATTMPICAVKCDLIIKYGELKCKRCNSPQDSEEKV